MPARPRPRRRADAIADYVFVDNVVVGHLLAEAKLREGAPGVSGQAFCLSNEAPLTLAQFWRRVQTYRPALKISRQPIAVLWVLAYVVEALQWLTRNRVKGQLGMLTPAMMQVAGMDYAFSSARARARLGYRPLYTVDQGIQRIVWAADQEQGPRGAGKKGKAD